jgi:hypothetical protein
MELIPTYFTVGKGEPARHPDHVKNFDQRIFPALGLFFVDSF